MKIHPITGLSYVSTVNRTVLNSVNTENDYNDTFKRTITYNAIPFTGVDGKGKVKQRGMMFHITSLPATRSYCGQFLDPETDKFIDFLHDSRQTHWIMNPLFALGPDLCPYNSSGRFSKNKYIVNLNELTKDKYGNLLKQSELPDDVTAPVFTLDMLKGQKDPRFEKAYSRFEKLEQNHPLKKEYRSFEKENKYLWLDTYAAYDALSVKYGDNWKEWPKDLQMLPEKIREGECEFKDVLNAKDIKKFNQYKFEQFLFDKQFNEFNNQLKSKNINLILDLAIGVSPNGVDTWANKDIFLLDKNFNPVKVSGCPSESEYPRTQVWGHPLFDYDNQRFWEYQEASLRKMINEADLRLDHFVGYINRAEIPTTYTKPDGTVLCGDEIFAPVEKGGMGKEFFQKEWISRIDKKTNSRGENMFELFKRVAIEEGKKPEECYILEDFGPLGETEAYKEFKEKFGQDFISQRVPVAKGIGSDIKRAHNLNNPSNPYKLNTQGNTAILTGNHDQPSLIEYIDKLLDSVPKIFDNGKNSPALFREFCKKELKLSNKEMKDHALVEKEFMKWHYAQDSVKQVQTTLQDALGIYYRPNIPGYWNGMDDKYKMKPTSEALLPYWSKVFPKGFLERTDKSGINPGYKDQADNFIKTMDDLYATNDK